MREIIPNEIWTEKAIEHRSEVETLVGDWNTRRKQEEKHPVIDFLFRYFSFPYNRLVSWTPGLNVELEGPLNELLNPHRFGCTGNIIKLKESLLPVKRMKAIKWTVSLLERTATNPTCFNCYGMHEWAMVYKTDSVRHEYTKLRFGDEEISAIVEDKELNCTHYDALRFYTPAAVPLNKFSPTRETQEEFEQSACLHANMDLYKWAYKMYPFISSELLLKCFKLALDCRTVDMKASPYDLRDLGYEPICIETPQGKELYVKEQLRLKIAGEPIRAELLKAYKDLQTFIESFQK